MAARCSYLCGYQTGWTTANGHEIIVAAARIPPVRRVTLVNCALVMHIPLIIILMSPLCPLEIVENHPA